MRRRGRTWIRRCSFLIGPAAHRPILFLSACSYDYRKAILDNLTAQAKVSPRQRMNYNFHKSLDDKCHRMLNAIEPGTDIPIHRHPDKDESFVVLRGKVRSTTYNDYGSVIESVVLCAEEGRYGVNISKGVWHKLESLGSGSVVFECKEGPFVPHEIDGILELPKE